MCTFYRCMCTYSQKLYATDQIKLLCDHQHRCMYNGQYVPILLTATHATAKQQPRRSDWRVLLWGVVTHLYSEHSSSIQSNTASEWVLEWMPVLSLQKYARTYPHSGVAFLIDTLSRVKVVPREACTSHGWRRAVYHDMASAQGGLCSQKLLQRH